MSLLIINGSPKGKNGNTEIFMNKFLQEIKTPYEISYAVKEDSIEIANYMKAFDTIIVVMPLYVHAMPGIVMKIIECMKPTSDSGKTIGFIVQSGFMESSQSKYLESYLSALTKRLNYVYLGTVIRGGSAGTYMMPEKMNEKLYSQLKILGEHFETKGSFHEETVKKLAKPYKLSKAKCKVLQSQSKIGLGDTMFWNMMLKQNKAYDKRFDKPFVEN